MGETRRYWIVAGLGALMLVAGCVGTGASATPNASSQTTATVAGSAFLFSTVVPPTATVGPPTATAAATAPPIATEAPPTSIGPPPTETEIAASTATPDALVATPEPVITPQSTPPPATATPAPVPTRPRPSATHVPIVPTATPIGVTFLAVKGAKPGQAASVSVQAAPGATCSIAFSTTHGTATVPAGLEPKKADSQGRITWSWLIGAGTAPGTGAVIVTCGKASAFTNITIG